MFVPGTGRNGVLNSHPEVVTLITSYCWHSSVAFALSFI